MRAFRRTERGVEGTFGDGERLMLADLARELLSLLADDGAGSPDPVIARFFPDAYADDRDAADDFRSLTEEDLRDAKRAAALTFIESLDGAAGSLVLDDETGEVWLLTLNDLRLAIGTRIGIEEDTYERLRDGALGELTDEQLTAFEVYDLLTWLQESLVHALTP
jgi:hypothetical protein